MTKITPTLLPFLSNFLSPKMGVASLAATACLLSAANTQAADEVVFFDDFSDGNRDGWYNSASSGGLRVDANDQLEAINTTSRFLTYFEATSLDVGESMTVSFDLEMESVGDNQYGFRIGILDSGGAANQVSADSYGSTNSDFDNYGGFRLNTNLGAATAGNTYFSARTGTGDNLLGDGMTSVPGLANGVNLSAETSYETTFTFSRTDDTTLNMSFTMNGIVLSTLDSAANTFTFDTLAFYKSGSAGGDIYLDNVEVSYSSIPEVSQISMALGALSAVTIGIRRKR